MSGCYQSFTLFDWPTPHPDYPDEMLPLLEQEQQVPHPILQQPRDPPSPNLDIILSKVLNNDELNDIELQQLGEHERLALEEVKLKGKKDSKRPDEYQKLFFKRAFKFAEKQYFGRRNKNRSRKMSSFYHHHFEGVAQRLSVPIVNFYHPDRKTRPGLKIGQKSFNQAYIRLILSSPTFRAVSNAYLARFKRELNDERRAKVPKFAEYLRSVISKHRNEPQRIVQMVRSSKCKVPWSHQDIEEADRRARAEMEDDRFRDKDLGGDEVLTEREADGAMEGEENVYSEDSLSASE